MIRILVGGRDVTRSAASPTASNVDPGGYEAFGFELPVGSEVVNKGDEVLVLDGLDCVFFGRVEEPGLLFERDAGTDEAKQRISCVGRGAALKDVNFQALIIDRDLAEWKGASSQYRRTLLASFGQLGDPSISPDSASPAVRTGWSGSWQAAPLTPIAEAWYDAGYGNAIGALYVRWTRAPNVNQTDANWNWVLVLSADEQLAVNDVTANLRADAPADASLTASGYRRWAVLALYYLTASNAGGDGIDYFIDWSRVTVVGSHGMALRSYSPGGEYSTGFYPSDIVKLAMRNHRGPVDLRIQDSPSYVVAHCNNYRQAVPLEQVPDEMAKLVGYHWGMWEPSSPFNRIPIFRFQPPPSHATATCSLSAADAADLAASLSDYHDSARVSYRDSYGTESFVVIEQSNPALPEGMTRVASYDIGVGSAAAAMAFGRFALALEQRQARGAGSVTLPRTVMTDAGPKGAHLLKAGVDRLRVLGLPNASPLVAADNRRFDTFRIRRVSTAWSEAGAPTTTVDLDAGSNLIEVLQARLQIAGQLAG